MIFLFLPVLAFVASVVGLGAAGAAFLGGGSIVDTVTASLPGNTGGGLSPEAQERKTKIQNLINDYLRGVYPDMTHRLLYAKVGGQSGVPANSETVKYILMYTAGYTLGYWPFVGDIFHPDVFNKIVGGHAGEWTASEFHANTLNFPGIENVSVDEGNDFGLARNTGTWLEDNFNLSCLGTALAGAAATLASGGTLAPGGLAATISVCKH